MSPPKHPDAPFRRWVYDQGYRLMDFAKILGVKRESVFFWLTGTRRPRPQTMAKIRELTQGKFKNPEDLLDVPLSKTKSGD